MLQAGLLDGVAWDRDGGVLFHGAVSARDGANRLDWRESPVATVQKIPKPPRIQALARASAIIDVIAAGDAEGTGLGEICRVTLLNKTTAFNLLASLVTLGFVEQDKQSKR